MPAGGFDSALASIEGGADALYLGFSDFSARKQARNFDALEYRRLYAYARARGIRLYATLNTVVMEEELEGASSLLAFLGRFPPDAVLVQDWGLARLIRERYPGISVHASTQAAAQGAEAARIARELGATRVVLPRETSLAEMRRLREEEPGLEYEAFVHGALCYSFSGLCLASGLVLGRSGNRGECAQLCRSYYDAEGLSREGRGGRGYWFSCRDLELGDEVGELADAGIASLKVEGRMKGPEYCYAVARLYRGLIDSLGGSGPGEAELAARREAARTAFSRSPTEAWLRERGGAALVDPAYPGHRGVPAGRIARASGSSLVLDLSSDLGLRDGLLGFERGDESRPLRFPVLELKDAGSGRPLVRAKAGSRVEIDLRPEGGGAPELKAGETLYRISAREFDRKSTSPEEFEAAREELGLELSIGPEGIGARLGLPGCDGRGGPSVRSAAIEPGGPVPLDMAKSAGGFERALALFAESGDADFRLVPRLDAGAPIELPPDDSGLPRSCLSAEIFVPPSVLKREKNRIYARSAELVAEAEASYARESLASLRRASAGAARARGRPKAPPRSALVFPREGLPSGMPFATRRDLIRGAALPEWGGRSWLPLAPLVEDRVEYTALARGRVREELGRDGHEPVSLAVGLNALHHFILARELASEHPEAGERLVFFLDFNLYVANGLAYASLAGLVQGIEFAYRYIEAPEPSALAPIGPGFEPSALAPIGPGFEPSALAPIGPGFEPPLFQSLGCLMKHHLMGGACPELCSRSWSTAMADRDRRYLAIVEDCVTMLFRIDGEGGRSP
jgi:U32 family peptidase